jgi:hypothetical protein
VSAPAPFAAAATRDAARAALNTILVMTIVDATMPQSSLAPRHRRARDATARRNPRAA